MKDNDFLHLLDIEVGAGFILSLILSVIKIAFLEDILHGIFTALGGLMVTLVYALIRKWINRKRGKGGNNE
jgi:hypothetical protein